MENSKLFSGAAGRRRIILLLLVLLTVLAVSLHYCAWKSGMFIDEIYTYGLANSRYMPFIGNGEHDRIAEQCLTREDFFDYLAVTEGEPRFDAGSVYYNQVKDVHPPLHYWIINAVSSLAAGHFSKWIGLIPDLLIYLGTLILLFCLCLALFRSDAAAALTALLYGLSTVGLSTVLMIRMYVLVSFFTVLLAFLVLRELSFPSRRKELSIALCIYLGLMTQYYFVFYAFFLCAAAVIVLLFRRDWKSAVCFVCFSFAAVLLMLVCFPSVFAQMTGHRLGPDSDALENLKNISAWPGRLRFYFGQTHHGQRAAALAAVFALLFAGTACAVRHRPFPFRREEWAPLLVLLLPLLPTVAVVAMIAPVVEGRYIYNIMPIVTLAAGYALHLALLACGGTAEAEGKATLPKISLIAAAVVLSVFLSLTIVPDYIYDEHRDFNALVNAHADAPCVYFTEYYAGPTQDMLQLMSFDDVYVTGDPASAGLQNYLTRHGGRECVVFIDVDSIWGSGFDSESLLDEFCEETGFADPEPLYRYALSQTYLLRR